MDIHLLSTLLPSTETLQFPCNSAYLTFQISVSHVVLCISQDTIWASLVFQHETSPKINLRLHWCCFRGALLGSDLFNGGELEILQHVCNIRVSNLKIYLFSWVGTKGPQSTERDIRSVVTGGNKSGYIPDFITPRTDHLFHTRLWVTQLQCVLYYYCKYSAYTLSSWSLRSSFQCGHLTGSVGTLNLGNFHTGTTICRVCRRRSQNIQRVTFVRRRFHVGVMGSEDCMYMYINPATGRMASLNVQHLQPSSNMHSPSALSGKRCQLHVPSNVGSPAEVIIIRETHRDNGLSNWDLAATLYCVKQATRPHPTQPELILHQVASVKDQKGWNEEKRDREGALVLRLLSRYSPPSALPHPASAQTGLGRTVSEVTLWGLGLGWKPGKCVDVWPHTS